MNWEIFKLDYLNRNNINQEESLIQFFFLYKAKIQAISVLKIDLCLVLRRKDESVIS